jgi:hypothetical protein
LIDRDDPDDLAILVGEEGDADVPHQRGIVPMASVGGAIRKIQHDLGHPGVLQPGPDLGDEFHCEMGTWRPL